MAIQVLDGDPVAVAAARAALERACQVRPDLGTAGRDLAILPTHGRRHPTLPRPTAAVLVVMTGRPSVTQASASLLLGAEAYLPFDLAPEAMAEALDVVAGGHLHVEPEGAAALDALLDLTSGDQVWVVEGCPPVSVEALGVVLALRARGRSWEDSLASGGLERECAERWLRHFLAWARNHG